MGRKKSVRPKIYDQRFFPEAPEGLMLSDAQLDIIDSFEVGESVDCPCCGRNVQIYAKRLSPTLVARLINLVGDFLDDRKWKPVPTKPAGTNVDFTLLTHWDFIVVEKAGRGKKKSIRVYPTKKAYDFVCKRTKAKSHYFVFNGMVVGDSGKDIDVIEALKGKHQYNRLIQSLPTTEKGLQVGFDNKDDE
jgi:hypothetical protein